MRLKPELMRIDALRQESGKIVLTKLNAKIGKPNAPNESCPSYVPYEALRRKFPLHPDRTCSLGRDRIALRSLLLDPDALDSIIDHESLFQAVQEKSKTLKVSSQFYFYLLVQHTLLGANIYDINLADYVASLLVDFAREDSQKKSFQASKPLCCTSWISLPKLKNQTTTIDFFSTSTWKIKRYFSKVFSRTILVSKKTGQPRLA